MRGNAAVLAFVLVAFAAACGGSGGGGWQVVKEVKASGSSPGFIDNAAVARPADIEVAVSASPTIKVQATFAFICGDVTSEGSTTADSSPAKTPATLILDPPSGPPNACRVNVLVSKSHPADMTVTLRMRNAPATES
jgi:hypothetical protein